MANTNPHGFVCDDCRYRHEFARDVGKHISVEQSKHEDGQTCTGVLCRRCTYGDMNRAARRANREGVCVSPCTRRSESPVLETGASKP